MNVTELRAKAQKIAHEARAKLNEIKEDNSNAAEVEATFDKMIAEADALEARAKRIEDLEAREAAWEAADVRRPVEDRSVEARGSKSLEERQADAFRTYLKSGDTQELRAQSVGTASEGGYLVPTILANELIVGMKAYGPLNNDGVVSYVRTATGAPINFPTLDDTSNKGSKIGENTQVSSASVAFGTKALDAYKYTTGAVLVSKELLQDASFDVSAIVTAAMAERMGRIINEVMTTGDGSGDPNGIVTAAANGKTAASTSAIAADELIDLIHSVDPAYRGRASFMFADSTLNALRKLKDSEGRYIWQPGLVAGEAATILGHKFYVNSDMAAIGAGTKSVLFGDFSRYYVRQVLPFEIVRLTERYADYGQVGFIGFARYDGELMDARAVKALTQAAS
ncbi:phage major capsid protein [Brevundimonas sp. 2R-24]|uniref:Phage major capsid protein n=1 Tax=Peiella sedimenti TaxID=3061083 RepID=A0ABT8SPN8_9CAUL|nr:phage major capsid protein [Caulobacteraceae bacterium XZ-24]